MAQAQARILEQYKVKWYRSTFYNALILGICNFLAPRIWGAMNSLGAGGAEKPYLVNSSNGMSFSLMVSSYLFSSTLVHYIGNKWSLIVGTLGYVLYAMGLYTNNRFGTQWTVLFGAAMCGLSAGIFWMSEAAIALSYPEPYTQGRFFGFWLSFRLGGQVLGGATNLGINAQRNQAGSVSYEVYLVFITLQAIEPVAGHLNPGLFKYPGDQQYRYNDVDHWIALAQKVEAAKFHGFFFADALGGNFGLTQQIEHDKRYEMADEYLEVVYKLWESSWREGARVNDGKVFTDPSAVRQINHKGKYFDVPGPALTEPSPQRTPFLLQAGTSGAGKAFAAKHAEAIFVNAHHPELIKPSVDSLRSRAKDFGRYPNGLKIIAGVFIIVAETNEAAQAKLDDLSKYGDREGALALFGGWSGFDLSKYSDKQDFRFVDEPTIRSMVTHWAKTVPGTEGKPWNKKTIAYSLIIGGQSPKIVGNAETVADELER
ncbi:putative xenobiotic compound family [Phaeomoniella chlamydospora]|uniref:Putative xenobiotic compound family n=1 Tax=Phaeomoniella chlamydospora TaxID=158046 RepID=A0A0G2GEP0_PHACM|nr:putative xenobiotic compound family [Phaeomoniella chlamydospora]